MATPTHLVLRPFPGPGGHRFTPPERVAADDWKNLAALENQRYLRRLGPADVPAPTKTEKKGS